MASSYTDLVRLFGQRQAFSLLNNEVFKRIEATLGCGRPGAVIWALLTDRESCKRYGSKGDILHTEESIGAATGYPLQTVFAAVLGLAKGGYIRFSPDGRTVKAA